MIKVRGIKETLNKIDRTKKIEIERQKNSVLNSLVNKLKDATPVDTGEARDGWKRELNSIVNEVPHIEYLNEGSSQQAPAYFIERTVLSEPGVKPNGMIVKKT